ncbi:MAG: sporulation integral membrane protein YtvI [Lachnospiraceae bacterium]
MEKIPQKYLKALVNVGFATLVFILCIWILPKILWLFMPFIIGWLLSLMANPLVRFFEDKIKIKRKAGSALVIVTVIAGICLVIYGVGLKLAEEAYGLLTSLPSIWASLEQDFSSIASNWGGLIDALPDEVVYQVEEFGNNLGQHLSSFIGQLSVPTVGAVGNLAKNIPSILVAVIMCLLAAYFFVAEKEFFVHFVEEHFSDSLREKGRLMKNTMLGAIGGYFKAQLKIEVWIYLIVVIGFFILRIQYGFLIALGIALLDILPIFGTGSVLIPWAIIKFLSGQYGFGIGLLIIWGVGQLTRQIIQPKIVGDSIGMPPIPTLILLYAGYRLAGILGMIIAVPLGILVMTMNEAGFFNNTKNSLRILWRGFNHFRMLEESELEEEWTPQVKKTDDKEE